MKKRGVKTEEIKEYEDREYDNIYTIMPARIPNYLKNTKLVSEKTYNMLDVNPKTL